MQETQPERERTSQKRGVASLARIADINNGAYFKTDGWDPNYVLTSDNRMLQRVNIIGAVIDKPEGEGNSKSIVIDDGSGSIPVRTFEEYAELETLSPGDVVLVIGRPREYGNEKYILLEIVRKVTDKKWIEVRKRELDALLGPAKSDNLSGTAKASGAGNMANARRSVDDPALDADVESVEDVNDEANADTASVEEKKKQLTQSQRIVALIRECDRGDGADIEEVLSGFSENDRSEADRIINRLLEEGEIFEVKPGRLKVL